MKLTLNLNFSLEKSLIIVTLFSMIAGSCKSRSSNTSRAKQAETIKTGFDINDLSVLFPFPKSKEEMGILLKSDQSLKDGTLLWDPKAFKEVLEVAETIGDVTLDVGGNKVRAAGPGITLENFSDFSFKDSKQEPPAVGGRQIKETLASQA